MALVDAEEAHPDGPELGWGRYPERPAGAETQCLGVEVEQARRVNGGQHDVSETLSTGDEPGSERRHDRAVVEHRPVEHLDRVARGVVEGDDLLDAARVGLGEREFLERHAGIVEGGLHAL